MNIQGENKSRNNLIGLLPLWIVMGVFMIGPLIVMAFVSIMESNSYGGIHIKFDLSGYRQILFDTNLFSNIEVIFDENRLQINVKENPTINLVKFSGNSKIKDEDLVDEKV